MALNSSKMDMAVDNLEKILLSKGYNDAFHIYTDHSGTIGSILRDFIRKNQVKIKDGKIHQVCLDSDIKKIKLSGEYVVCCFDLMFNKKNGFELTEMSINYLLGQEGQLTKFLPVSTKADIPTKLKAIKIAESMRWGKHIRKKKKGKAMA